MIEIEHNLRAGRRTFFSWSLIMIDIADIVEKKTYFLLFNAFANDWHFMKLFICKSLSLSHGWSWYFDIETLKVFLMILSFYY